PIRICVPPCGPLMAGLAARMSSNTARSSALAPVRAHPMGSPCRVQSRCRRKPQKNLEWEAQYPYSAHPARSERLTVSRDRAHSTGVESMTHTSSVATLVSVPSILTSQDIVPDSLRSLLL